MVIKLQDFATQQGVTDRQIQRLLKKYAEELEGTFERKGPNGTWLSDEACEILRSKMRQNPIVLVDASEREEELQQKIRDLEKELFQTQKEYTTYVSNVTPILQKASEQLALAERAGEYKSENDALKAQNASLSAEKDAEKANTLKAEENAQKASEELSAARKQIDKMKNASLWQRIRGWKE